MLYSFGRYWDCRWGQAGFGLAAMGSPLIPWVGGVWAIVVVVLGAVLVVLSVKSVPVEQVEKPWRDGLNKVRNGSGRCMDWIRQAYDRPRYRKTVFHTLDSLLASAAWPDGADEPQDRWKARFYADQTPATQQLYDFAEDFPGRLSDSMERHIHEFRRDVIEVFDGFGTELRKRPKPMRRFMERNQLQNEFSDIVLLIAYLDIGNTTNLAKKRNRWSQSKPNAQGFWWLCDQWFPTRKIVRKPKPLP